MRTLAEIEAAIAEHVAREEGFRTAGQSDAEFREFRVASALRWALGVGEQWPPQGIALRATRLAQEQRRISGLPGLVFPPAVEAAEKALGAERDQAFEEAAMACDGLAANAGGTYLSCYALAASTIRGLKTRGG